jgi:hypothetical protein
MTPRSVEKKARNEECSDKHNTCPRKIKRLENFKRIDGINNIHTPCEGGNCKNEQEKNTDAIGNNEWYFNVFGENGFSFGSLVNSEYQIL